MIALRHLRGPVSLTGGQSQASIFNDLGVWLQCAMEGEMVDQPTAEDRLIDRRSVLRTGATLAPAPRLMAGRRRRLRANSRSVPDACESRFGVTWSKVRMPSFAAHILVSTLRSRLLAGGVVAGFLAVTLIPSVSAAAEDSIPQLGSRDFGWNA